MGTRKKVLIVGMGSYIGTSFCDASSELFDIATIDAQKPLSVDQYKGFDCVLHVAGIAHVSKKKSMEPLYYKVNRDLAIQSAELAREAGVKQFIFMSSMIVYGGDLAIGKRKIIDINTQPNPEDFYGESKLQADVAIQKMGSNDFHTVVIRTPMVYGPNCKGNYPKLISLALKLPFIPNIENERSAIEISTLVSYFQTYILKSAWGLFFPRDEKPFCTSKVMANARALAGKKPRLTRFFNPLIWFLSLFVNKLRKMFGTKVYSDALPKE